MPDAAVGHRPTATDTTPFGNKGAVAKLAGGFSKRWVDAQMARGMPHLKIGARRVRFDLEEVHRWLKDTYTVQKRGNTRGGSEKENDPRQQDRPRHRREK